MFLLPYVVRATFLGHLVASLGQRGEWLQYTASELHRDQSSSSMRTGQTFFKLTSFIDSEVIAYKVNRFGHISKCFQ